MVRFVCINLLFYRYEITWYELTCIPHITGPLLRNTDEQSSLSPDKQDDAVMDRELLSLISRASLSVDAILSPEVIRHRAPVVDVSQLHSVENIVNVSTRARCIMGRGHRAREKFLSSYVVYHL